MQKLREPENNCRKVFFLIAYKPVFDHIILICIFLNTIVLAFTWYNENKLVGTITEMVNYIFAGIFTLEAVIKIIAFDKNYFRDSWNIFDLLIVVGTLIGAII